MENWIKALKTRNAENDIVGAGLMISAISADRAMLDNVQSCKMRGAYITSERMGWDWTCRMKEAVKGDAEIIGDVIDASLLNNIPRHKATDMFCATMIAALHKHFLKTAGYDMVKYQDEYFNSLREVSEALESAQNASSSTGIDAIYAFQDAIELPQEMHRHLALVSRKLFGGKMLCFLVDGMDHAVVNGWCILESIQKYLATPYAAAIVHADDTTLEAISAVGPVTVPETVERKRVEDDDDDW